MNLRGPMAVVAVVLAAVVLAAAAVVVVVVVVSVILVSRYQSKEHIIKKPLNLSSWCGVKNPAHKSSSPHTQKITTGQQYWEQASYTQISPSSRKTVDRTCKELSIT
jgi:hypothetical protein